MIWFLDKPFLTSLDVRAYDAAAIADWAGLPVDVVEAFVDPGRRYRVTSNPGYGWLAGASAGNPALLFLGPPRQSDLEQEPVNVVVHHPETGAVTTHAIAVDGDLTWDTVLDAAEAAIGFVDTGSAPMPAFIHPELWYYALVPFTFTLHDAFTGGGVSEAEPADVRSWIEDGNYVLHCGNDYHMRSDGSVESS